MAALRRSRGFGEKGQASPSRTRSYQARPAAKRRQTIAQGVSPGSSAPTIPQPQRGGTSRLAGNSLLFAQGSPFESGEPARARLLKARTFAPDSSSAFSTEERL